MAIRLYTTVYNVGNSDVVAEQPDISAIGPTGAANRIDSLLISLGSDRQLLVLPKDGSASAGAVGLVLSGDIGHSSGTASANYGRPRLATIA